MITRIKRMRKLGIFRDFTWPSDLTEFGRYNLIYGWNWSGKTTLSNLLRKIETRTNEIEAQVTVSIGGKDTPGSDFSEASVPIRVFNREFVAENVFTIDGDVAPIYVLGEKNVEKQKHVDELQENRSTKTTAESDLDNFCRLRAKVIKDTLSSSGASHYNNYDKADFRRKAENLSKLERPEEHRLDETTRTQLLQQHVATPKPKVAEIEYEFPDLTALSQEASRLLSTTVVSAVIEALKNDPDLAAWTRAGLLKHEEQDANICLFCGQELPPDRLKELEAHFSNEYERLLGTINKQIADLRGLVQLAANLSPANKAQLYDDLAKEYESALKEFLQEVNSTTTVLSALEQALTAKKDAPFEARKLKVAMPVVNIDTLGRVNDVIAKHNQACEQFQERIEKARHKLENDSVAANLDEYLQLSAAVENADKAVTEKQQAVTTQETEVAKREREIIGHREPAEERNRELHDYLGHNELQVQVKETGYEITRD